MTARGLQEWAADERRARAALSFLTEPGDPVIGGLLRSMSAGELLAAADPSFDGSLPRATEPRSPGCRVVPAAPAPPELAARRSIERMRARLAALPPLAFLDGWERSGLRLVWPGDPEWPTQLSDLGPASPVMLWLRGAADLRFACLRSVSVVGSRAATSYGTVVGTDLAANLSERNFTVISGGAYGIDASAHRGALAVAGPTVAVLASGLSFGYPKGHYELFEAIAATGVMVSERPPDLAPNRPGFLVRNRLIAALSRGTVVVEAARRSGALNTARQAIELNRSVMAVPGPITSTQSAGCHELIREWGAVCVTGAADIMELIAPLGDDATEPDTDAAVPAEVLDPVTASVLQTLSIRTGRGPATIATLAKIDLDTALRCLGLLAAAGYAERCDQGWRARRPKPRQRK